jgi:Pyruvate/2-oxoglutarate dehydrogenase complex, dehydrogenase (E1) component, eukaryotic type, beta subunit
MILSYKEAINKALYDALEDDSDVVLFGEDDRNNLYGYTEGLYEKFGDNRVIDTPLSEAGVVGAACGAAICGLRPIVDLTTENFLYVAMDQICSIAAKTAYMYDGVYSVPITIFSSSMSVGGNAAQHSDRIHSLFMNIPGLKIICPATAQDMYSMLREAIKDNNPVLCFADRTLFWMNEEVNIQKKVEIGKAKKVRDGTDLTIVSVSGCMRIVKELLPEIEALGISADVLDVRSVVPLDFNAIKESVKKTGRIVICDTANRTGSLAGHISSLIVQYAFEYLKAPIRIAACEDIPIPYAKKLESSILVSKEKIKNEIKIVLNYKAGGKK